MKKIKTKKPKNLTKLKSERKSKKYDNKANYLKQYGGD